MKPTILLGALLVLLTSLFAPAAVRLVPDQYLTIQQAIDDCNAGDTVIVAPGTYTGPGNRDIDFKGKAITVRSTNPKDPAIVAATIVDCNGSEAEPHRGFDFHSGENRNCVLDGLTISNGYCGTISRDGYSMSRGGGISCDEAAPKIINCVVTDNYARSGGGIYCADACNVAIINCTVADNTCNESGAGIYCLFSSVLVERCVVSGNSIMGRDSEYGWGAGINCGHCDATVADCVVVNNASSYVGGGFYCIFSSVTLDNCTFAGNSAQRNGAIICSYSGNAAISNCIVWGNWAAEGEQIRIGSGYDVAIEYSNIQGGQADVFVSSSATLDWGQGNIEADPGFVDVVSGNYHLSPDSPCIDGGDLNYVPFSGEADIDGHERIANGRVDIGADEFGSAPVPILDLWPGNLDYFVYEDYGNPPAQLLAIQNRGAGVMNWAITEDCPWLDISPVSGECINETDYVVLSADAFGLPHGVYDYELVVNAGGAIGGAQIIDVNFVIYGPEIELSATEFEFAAIEGEENPPDQKLTIRNAGGGKLSWEIVADSNWLKVTPLAGMSKGDNIEVTLSADISALKWGNYECEVLVVDANSLNSPQAVTVRLHVFVGDLIRVPSRIPTIQGAIDRVLEGGTVLVADGIYSGEGNHDIDFRGKAITVRSENGPGNCIIDCSDPERWYDHRGFGFHSGEDSNSVLNGFTITNGRVRGCFSSLGGAAILCSSSSPMIANCIITNNKATGGCIAGGSSGGGIGLFESRATITNCIVTGNMAYGGAGGIHCYDSSPIITNCTICDNIGSGIWGVPYYGEPYRPIIANCILWGNSLEQMVVDPNTTVVTFSNVQGGWPGLGNISEDPLFVDHGYWDPNDTTHATYDDFWVNGDYHLKSNGWRWDAQRKDWTWDEITSRCIDAGNPGSPLGEEPLSIYADPNNEWGRNLRINMGAYGGTAEASMPPYGWALRNDYNADGIANFTDFACWSIYHGYIQPEPPDDSSPSPTLNAADLALLADRWLDQTTWFTTPSPASSLPPNAASNPDPPDGSVGIRLAPVLSWQGGFDAVSHDIYFGTANPPPFQTNQPGRTFEPRPLSPLTAYYWRIDEVKPYGTTVGPVWTFTTSSAGGR